MTFKVSDESLNSYGFRVLSSGGDFTQFNNNPVMLYDHDENGRLPIGTWKDLQTHANGDITAIPEFDEEDQFALSVGKKCKKGIIKMASIGIIPLEMSDDPSVMLPGQQLPTVTRWVLREISITPFGSNRNAFKMYDSDGNLMNLSEAKKFIQFKNQDTMSETLKPMIVAALSLKDGISDSDLVKEVLKLHQANNQLTTEITTLKAEKVQLSESIANKEKEALIDKAVAEKKITLKQKEVYMKLSMDDAKSVLDSLAPATDLSKIPGTESSDGREKWSFNDWSKKDPKGLIQMKLNDKTRFVDLFEKEFGSKPSV